MEKLYRLGEAAQSSLPSEGETKDLMGGRGETGDVWGPRAPREPDEGHKGKSRAPKWRMAEREDRGDNESRLWLAKASHSREEEQRMTSFS